MDIGKVQGFSLPLSGVSPRGNNESEQATNEQSIKDVLATPAYSETPSGIKYWKGSALTAGDVYQTPNQKAGGPAVILIVPKYWGFIGRKAGGVDPFGNSLKGQLFSEDGHKKIGLTDPKTGTISTLDRTDSTLEMATAPIIAESRPFPNTYRTIIATARHETLKADGEIDFRTNEKVTKDLTYYIPHGVPAREGFPVKIRHTNKEYEETIIPRGGAPVTNIVEEQDGKKTVKGTLPSRIEGDDVVIDRPDGTKDRYELFIPPSHLPGQKQGA